MKLSRTIALGLSMGALLLFSGCVAKGVQCRIPDSSTIELKAFESSSLYGTMVAKDLGNLFGETIYNNNIKIDGNIATAEKSKISAAFTWSGLVNPWQIKLDANKDTAQIGETIYSCDKGLAELVQTLQKGLNKQTLSETKQRNISSNDD